jgi:plasmid stabilization system protein ParE
VDCRRVDAGAAARMDEILSDAAARLAQHPMLGKPGTIPGTRELIPHESDRLVYQIDGDTVWILAPVHTARLWPPVRDQERVMATRKRRVDRLLSSQTAVGGHNRPFMVRSESCSLAPSWMTGLRRRT